MFNFFKAASAAAYAGSTTMMLATLGLKLEPEKYPCLPVFFHNARASKLSMKECAGLIKTIIDAADAHNADEALLIEARNVNLEYMVNNWQEKIENFKFIKA